jgi:hypothetical protein
LISKTFQSLKKHYTSLTSSTGEHHSTTASTGGVKHVPSTSKAHFSLKTASSGSKTKELAAPVSGVRPVPNGLQRMNTMATISNETNLFNRVNPTIGNSFFIFTLFVVVEKKSRIGVEFVKSPNRDF